MPKTTLDLTGEWEFKEYPLSARRMRDLDAADWLQTAVPSSVFTGLINVGKIKQVDIDTYPENFSWVSEKPWIYRKIFDAPQKIFDSDRIDMVFEGLDTIASIWLNDKLIGKTNNMFIPHRFDVTGLLKPQNNSLLVKFDPATHYAKHLMSRYTSFGESEFTNPHRVYIRKAQYQFGWDWCPSLPGCGIWQPVRIEAIKKACIDELHIRTVDCNSHYADVKITVKLDTVAGEKFLCALTLSSHKDNIRQELTFEPGENTQSTLIRIENPLLWWPAGYGPQNLYKLDVELLNSGQIIDQTQRQIGIRTIKLNLAPDEHGENFRFEINGRPVYAKGANWIPASIFAGSVTDEDYEQLLHAAADANMNMLRVWGGGYYETEKFYNLCDRLGIMVWQDFMFACAYYPDRKWFLRQIKTEAAQVIKRLRNHPSLVLWCGNNEIDMMHSTGKFGKNRKFHGRTIYHRLLPQLVADLDPDANYIPTSPLAQNEDFKTGRWLTMHQWDVWSGHQPVWHYLCPAEDIPRFVPEFGFQSLPSLKTIRNFCPPQQLYIGSQTLEKHNYQLDGNSRLHRYIADLFGTAQNLEQFVYLSQVTQARAIKTYVEHLRAHNSKNNGVLFWQLNDCCPAVSWSAIDQTKEPKALFHYAKRFFSKVLIAVVSGMAEPQVNLPPLLKSLNVVVINDSDQPLTTNLSCRLIDLYGNLLDQVEHPVVVAPFSTSAIPKLPKDIVCPADSHKCCIHLLMKKDGKKIAENLFFYLPDKYIDWPKAQITKSFSQVGDKCWKLKLCSDAIAKDVCVSTSRVARFSDNFIDLVPPDAAEIIIDFEEKLSSIESLLQMFSVKSTFPL